MSLAGKIASRLLTPNCRSVRDAYNVLDIIQSKVIRLCWVWGQLKLGFEFTAIITADAHVCTSQRPC